MHNYPQISRSLVRALLLLFLSVAAPSAVLASDQGATFASFRQAVDHYDDEGFLLFGKFEHAQWPATVISEKEADDEISFTLRSGTPHRYPGYTGYRLKVVIFEDAGRNETVLVFRSKKKQDGSDGAVAGAESGGTRPEALRTGIATIAKQLSGETRGGPKRRIAVVDFADIDGRVPPAGAVIAELLIGELFRTGQYDIVERKLLASLLEEQKLNMSGLVDESTARKVGKLLGVECIVTGTVIDLGSAMNVNARTISVESGSIMAAGSADLSRDAFRNLPKTPVAAVPLVQPAAPAAGSPPPTGSFSAWMEEKAFGAEMDRLWKEGYYPAICEGRAGVAANEYRVVMQPFPKKVFWFYWWYGQLRSQYEEHKKQMTAEGFREISFQSFTDRDGMRRYQACWLKEGL